MIYPDTKIESLCNPNDSRVSLRVPHLDVNRSRMVSTNGGAMALVPVHVEENDVSGPVPVDAIKAARSIADKHGTCKLTLHGAATADNGATYARDMENPFFENYDRVVRDPGTADPDLSFDVDLLIKLVDALKDRKSKSKIIALYFDRDPGTNAINFNSSISVRVHNHTDRLGVIMPCRW